MSKKYLRERGGFQNLKYGHFISVITYEVHEIKERSIAQMKGL